MGSYQMGSFQRIQVGILKIHNKSYPIYEGVNTVGRNKEAVVNIKHLKLYKTILKIVSSYLNIIKQFFKWDTRFSYQNISHSHAVIIIINDEHFISDLKSSNGTFLENEKLEPFKLHRLKNNSAIKLGDLCGSYIYQSSSQNNDQSNFEMTQDVTQSIYGSNTQILDDETINNTNSRFEDIHEAPTQEISWSNFKVPRSVRPSNIDKNEKSIDRDDVDDIYNCITQPFDITSHGNELDKSEKTNSADVQQHEIQEANRNSGDTDNPIDCSDDIHEAPTQICPLIPSIAKSDDDFIKEPEMPGTGIDENLPFLENNDNYIEIHQIPQVDKNSDIHEAETQVVDISNIRTLEAPADPNVEDDDATDCEDNIDTETTNIKEDLKEMDGNNTEKNGKEDSTKNRNKCSVLDDDEDTDDSTDLFKLDSSADKEFKDSLKPSESRLSPSLSAVGRNMNSSLNNNSMNQNDNSTDESIHFKKKKVCQFSSDSETDDEIIDFKRNKKSTMVLSTQDIHETRNNKETASGVKGQDSYIIDDTDSETEIEREGVNLEGSIAATQNQSIPQTRNESTADLNDTDCIPATQDVHIRSMTKSKLKSPGSNEDNASSEESFKLGLTELMMTPVETINNKNSQDPCCSKSLVNTSPVFGESTVINNNSTENPIIKKQSLDGSMGLEHENNTSPVFGESTVINNNSTENPIIKKQSLDGSMGLEHEKIEPVEINDMSCNTMDIFMAPTQKMHEPCKNLNNAEDRFDETEFLYDVPTQQIEVKARKSQLDSTNTEMYLAPTQKIPTAFSQVNLDHNSSKEESMDDLYLQPTQELEDTFNQPTQKVYNHKKENSDFVRPSDVTITEASPQTRKKFVFKKASILDGSLSNILDNNTKQEPVSKEIRSSIEFELDGNLTEEGETSRRPSNPLSHILENLSETDEWKESDKKVSEAELKGQLMERKNMTNNKKVTDVSDSEDLKKDVDDEVESSCQTNIDECKKLSEGQDNIVKDNLSSQININEYKKLNEAQDSIVKDNLNLQSIENKNIDTLSKHEDGLSKDLDSTKILDVAKIEVKSNVQQTGHGTSETSIENKPDIKPIGRRTTRRLPSFTSDSTMFASNNESLRKNDSKDNSLNATNSEVNQTIAFLESKISKTKKTSVSSKILVKVPKTRKSMTISEVDSSSEKEKHTNFAGSVSISVKSSVTTRKSGRTKATGIIEKDNSAGNKTGRSKKTKMSISESLPEKTSQSTDVSQCNQPTNRTDELLTNKWQVEKPQKLQTDSTDSTIQSVVTRTVENLKDNAVEAQKAGKSRKRKMTNSETLTENPPSQGTDDSYPNQASKQTDKPLEKRRQVEKPQKLQSDTTDSTIPSVVTRTVENLKDNAVEAQKAGKSRKRKMPNLETLSEKSPSQGTDDSQPNQASKQTDKPLEKRRQVETSHQIQSDTTDSSIQSVDSISTPKKEKSQSARPGRKRKTVQNEKAESSDNTVQSVDINLITPKKQKIQINESVLNTKERELRKQKPKVVFTMLDSPKLVTMIKQLGGSVTDSVETSTVLVTEHVKRSQKLLTAVGLGKPICSPSWITESKKAHEFLDPWDFILTDPEAEKKWDFSLNESLVRGRTNKLLNSYNFLIQVTVATDVLKGAIESCGGKCISKIPAKPLENTFIISSMENQNKFKRIIKQHSTIKVIEPEAIFDGVLRQELRFSRHYLT